MKKNELEDMDLQVLDKKELVNVSGGDWYDPWTWQMGAAARYAALLGMGISLAPNSSYYYS